MCGTLKEEARRARGAEREREECEEPEERRIERGMDREDCGEGEGVNK